MQLLDKENKIYLLDNENFDFPTLDMMKDDLVCIGGDFHPQRIIKAYQNGLFPWYIDEDNYIHWFSPKKRMVLKPEEFKISKSLRRTINNKNFVIKSNQNFEEVIKNCANIKRKDEDSSWINEHFIDAYSYLFELNYAFSIECYLDDELVGGLYGLMIGDIFCGESMFSKVSNTSKLAFIFLTRKLRRENYKLIDCQVYNKHLSSLGAEEIPREEFLNFLNYQKL